MSFTISIQRPRVDLPRELQKQLPFATALALTKLGKVIQSRTVEQMRDRLDRPTPFALNSIFASPAKKTVLQTTVGLKDSNYNKSSQTSATIFGQLFSGGKRRYKRLEGALRRKGLIGADTIAVPGGGATLDSYGNLTAGQIVKLMSVIGLFGEQGYSANATSRTLARRAKKGKTKEGYATINGVVYFVSQGKGSFTRGALSWKWGRHQHLAAGIWAKTGVHGCDVKPILMFVRVGVYRQFISLPKIASQAVSDSFGPAFNAALASAVGGAR